MTTTTHHTATRHGSRPGLFGALLVALAMLGRGTAKNAEDDPAPESATSGSPAKQSDCPRAHTGGLLSLYDFRSADGDIVRDTAGTTDLRVSQPERVRRSEGSLEVLGTTLIRSDGPPTRLIEAIKRSGALTLEAWVQSADDTQNGPARIVSLARRLSQRNLTLGQDGDRFDVRLRTTETDPNGRPSLKSRRGSLTTEKTHVVYTRDRFGNARIYLNGEPSEKKHIAGSFSNWGDTYTLSLGIEVNERRPWRGTFYRVALYNRALSPIEIRRHFADGSEAPPRVGPPAPATPAVPTQDPFASKIAPLLARHCLECHDASTRKGRLDLSTREGALAGGRSGKAIVPGNAAESLLWQSIVEGDMPKKRPPLSAAEEKLLEEWLDAGAHWSLETIDPDLASTRGRSETWLRRLTVEEYVETVRSAVGVDIADAARDLMPPDLRADGFHNTAYNLNVDLGLVNAYRQLAATIVAQMDVVSFATRFSEKQLLTDNSMRGLIAKMGEWLLRGPLSEDEITAFRGISTTVASAGGDFEEAVRFILEAMLQAPRFVYRVESHHGDGTPSPVGDHELASRLSYILWGAPPDRELMRAVDEGRLFDCDDVLFQVRRMLREPRAVKQSCRFIYEWLDLGRLDHLRPNPKHFPNWDASLAPDMREETLSFFRDVVWRQKLPLASLLNAQVTWLTPRLAAHYRMPAKETSDEEASFARYDLTGVPERGGLLTHGSVLTVGGDEASMVSRGLFVLRDLLRGSVQDPPPCVDTTPIPSQPGLTQRGVAEQRIANPSCGGCHSKFEPLAFGLERFDGLGTYHVADEHGNALRDDGEVLFPGSRESIPYQSSAELMDLLASHERVQQCLVWKVTQFAIGRPLLPTDRPILDKIEAAAKRGGGTYESVITAIVMSELVQLTHTEAPPR